MRVLVVGNHEPLVAQIAPPLRRSGYECSDADMVRYDGATEAAGSTRRELIVVALSGDLEKAIAVLRNLRNTVQTPILAVGPADDPQYILRAMREGATAYIDAANVDADLEPAIHSIRAKLHADTPGGLVIGVIGACGGTGASTVAANLATALALKHGRTVLADLHSCGGDQPAMFDLEPAHTLADLCRNAARLDKSMFLQSLARHSSGVQVLAAPRTREEASVVTAEFVRQALAMARASFPYVVLDIERSFAPLHRSAIVQADFLVLTVRLDMVSILNARRVLDQLNAMGVDDGGVHLVVNQHRRPKEVPARKAEMVLGLDVVHAIPNDPSSVIASMNRGVPVIVDRPRSKVAKSFAAMAAALPAPHDQGPSPQEPATSSSLPFMSRIAAQYM